MEKPIKTKRGVYLDLDKSPYEYTNPYGDCFKFSSKKKLEMFCRDMVKEIERVEKFLDRNGLVNLLPPEIVSLLFRLSYKALYRKIER